MLTQDDVTQILDQLKTNADKLGLTWSLRPATVSGVNARREPMIEFDGPDSGQPIPATPLTGWPVAGTRVMVMRVPPNGEYIVGAIAGSSNRVATTHITSDSANINATETIVATVSAYLLQNRTYRVGINPHIGASNANNQANVRIYPTSDASGTEIQSSTNIVVVSAGAAGVYAGDIFTEYTPSNSRLVTFTTTLQFASGTGTVRLEAASSRPTDFYVEYVYG